MEGTFYKERQREVGTLYLEGAEEVGIELGGYDHFFTLLAEGLVKREAVVSLEDALRTTKVIELARVSSEEGKVMKVK